MNQNRFLLNFGSITFVSIVLFVLFIALPFIGNNWYVLELSKEWLAQFDKNQINIDIAPEPKPNQDNNEPAEIVTWSWTDFEGNNNNISVKIKNSSIEGAKSNRLNCLATEDIYGELYKYDVEFLDEFIIQLKNKMTEKNMDYITCIEYVCSAVQSINYTLILSSNGVEYPANSGNYVKCPCDLPFGSFSDECSSNSANGCCNNVDPIGVYSPLEFFSKKTGDCDTRALFAYTILHKLGFNVAVMTSESQWHSVLGINLPDSESSGLPYGEAENGDIFTLYELTSKTWRLGHNVEGNDWRAVLH
ncbi:MAG: hypothetical protein ACKO7P_01430 [Bacteroidota bacterium]